MYDFYYMHPLPYNLENGILHKHFPGETGVVYKGALMNWKHEPFQGVAVKTLKGNDIPTQPVIYLILV